MSEQREMKKIHKITEGASTMDDLQPRGKSMSGA